MAKLRVSLKRGVALEVDRVSIGNLKLVYVICADKRIPYKNKRSRIVYIGTTANGIDRLAQSAANHSDQVFALHGVNRFEVRVVTCTPRRNVKSWRKLERALLILFREIYGSIPVCNIKGSKMISREEAKLFSKQRLKDIIDDLS